MDDFHRFVSECKEDLRRIASATRGEQQYGDVVNEAWVMAASLSSCLQIDIDYLDPTFRKLLLSYLFQHLVRYTELNIRRSVRLDHGTSTKPSLPHPLMNLLESDENQNPLTSLLLAEATPAPASRHEGEYSLAAAYVLLLRRFNNQMWSVAKHLRISISHTYRCCRNATQLAINQRSLALAPSATTPALKPWRRHRRLNSPVQLTFDFEKEALPFPIEAEETCHPTISCSS